MQLFPLLSETNVQLPEVPRELPTRESSLHSGAADWLWVVLRQTHIHKNQSIPTFLTCPKAARACSKPPTCSRFLNRSKG